MVQYTELAQVSPAPEQLTALIYVQTQNNTVTVQCQNLDHFIHHSVTSLYSVVQFSSTHHCQVLNGLNIPWNSFYLDSLQRTVGQETHLTIPYI